MTNTIIISGPKLLPPKLKYRMIGGKEGDCMAEFKRDHPHYDPGTVFRCERLQITYFPMAFDAEAKVTEV
jgi:hypothetical protein